MLLSLKSALYVFYFFYVFFIFRIYLFTCVLLYCKVHYGNKMITPV